MNIQIRRHLFQTTTVLALLLSATILLHAQSSGFTYQGKLSDGGTPTTGNYDLQFALFDSLAAGNLVGTVQTVPNVSVTAGIFTVQIDFGAGAFPGANRWLEIRARLTNAPSFTTLSPRQQITSTPYAIRSLNASSADTVTVTGVPSGSGNYIQNNPASQQAGNFNISGNGTAGGTLGGATINAGQEFLLSGFRFLSVGNQSTYAGIGAGSGGVHNTFFGTSSGKSNGGGFGNTYFGTDAGQSNINSGHNSFFGNGSGFFSTGEGNTFFGAFTGSLNQTGSFNTLIGYNADVLPGNLSNATALGANAIVEVSNAVVLGGVAGRNGADASVNVGIGTTTPQSTLDITATGDGVGLLRLSTERPWVFRQAYSGPGTALRLQPITGLKNFEITAAGGANVATFVGDDANPRVGIGTTTPTERLSVNGNLFTSGRGEFGSFLKLVQIDSGFGAGTVQLCRNAANVIAVCTSSSLRYKQQIAPFSGGLDLISRLRPISFTWKMDGSRDLGLGAEDVAKVEPLLTTKNDNGEIEGVRYDRLNVVLINAIKQQQEQIEQLQRQQRLITLQELLLTKQQQQIAGLKQLVCRGRRRTGVCK